MVSVPEPRLSLRQWECLALAADHRSAKEIARLLSIAPSTVNDHLDAAIAKLGAEDRRDAARMFAMGLVGAPPEGIGGDKLRVPAGDSERPLSVTGAEWRQTSGSAPFHFLRGDRRSNELDGGQRIIWIVAISVAAAVMFATSVIIVDRLHSLLAR